MIPFLDLGSAYRELKPELDAAVARVLASGCHIGGPEVDAFEAEFAAYCQAAQCIGAPVIANAVKQSMTPDCMDCRASQ